MSRYPLLALLLVGALAAFGCAGGGSPTAPATPDTSGQSAVPENHVAWGVFDVVFDLESETARIVWNREAEIHLNVTSAITPPKCYDCVMVTGSLYNPTTQRWYLEVYFRNPTALTGYDVRAVLSNLGGSKVLMNPDGITSVWGAPMPFRAINVDPERTFGPLEGHGRVFDFYFPPGENWRGVTYIIDASWPGYVEEPLIEEGKSDPLINNGFATTYLQCKIWDHQGDLNAGSAIVDLTPLGGSPMTGMYDDGMHNDGGAGDGVFGCTGVTTKTPPGFYMMNVFASDTAGHMGWGQIMLQVTAGGGPGNNDPIIEDVATDRTTAKQPEKIRITVQAYDPDGDPLGYEFDCSSGSFSGQSGNSVSWSPSISNTGPQQITVYVLDDQGGSASQVGYLWSTNMAVIQGSTQGKIPPGTLQSIIPSGTLDMDDDFIQQVVYLNFWATSCPPCMSEMDELNEVYQHFKGQPGYVHILCNLGESASEINQLVSTYGYEASYWALDSSGSYYESTKAFGNPGYIPWHMLFDRDNRCRWADYGSIPSPSFLIEKIEQLL